MDNEKLCEVFLKKLKDIFKGTDVFLIYLINPQEQRLELKYSLKTIASLHIKEKHGDMIDRWVIKHNRPLFIEDVKKDFRFSFNGIERKFSSCIASPISLGDNIVGEIRLESKQSSFFSMDDLRFLQTLSEIFYIFLENNELYRRMEELAIKDPLTNLYLRNYALKRLKEEIIRSARHSRNIGILILDIDDFKKCNDTYGHLIGDMVLKHLSSILKENIKVIGSILCRFGGEEFLVILPNTSLQEARLLAQDLRQKVKDAPLKIRDKNIYMTISIGVASFPQDGKDIESILKKADDRLYIAKRTGKDKIC